MVAGRAAPAGAGKDAKFLRQVREHAEAQRQRYDEQRRRERENEREDERKDERKDEGDRARGSRPDPRSRQRDADLSFNSVRVAFRASERP